MKVLQFPLARITIGFVVGILLTYYMKPNPNWVFASLFISLTLFVLTYYLVKKRAVNTFYFGLTTYLLSCAIGSSTQIIHTESYNKDNYIHYAGIFEKPHFITVTLREQLKSSPFNNRFIAIVSNIDQTKQSGRLLLIIPKENLPFKFQIGNRLRIHGTLNKNSTSKNPNQFDYGKYLENKQIYGQLYANHDEIQISPEIEKNIWYYTSRFRTNIIQNLSKNHFNLKELNVAIALILGQQQDVDPEIIRDYQYAGAVHILSVSGLHIGFILLLITFLLKPFPNTKKGSFIKLIIVLLSLSLFGILAGLAPSVVRSVTMFSFVAIGTYLRRSVNIYHTLLVSILLILLFKPTFVFDVGFQLSYVALFFIIWLQPLLSSIWVPKNIVSKYIWALLTVSFAAQIGTLPLSIYYFHQFPGLFFITNLLIIPLLTVIMFLGVIVMTLAAFDYAPLFLCKALEWSIFIMNKIISSIASIEQFIIKDIPLDFTLFISFYLLLFTTIIWFKKPSYNKLITGLISCILLQICFIYNQIKVQNQEELIVFNSKKNTLIAERIGKKVTLYANDSILKSKTKNNILNSYLVANFSLIQKKKKLQNVIFFKGNKILIIDSCGVYPERSDLDVLILTQSPKLNLERVLKHIKPKIIIADASNSKVIQKLWKATCFKQKIPFHSTYEKGFYKIN